MVIPANPSESRFRQEVPMAAFVEKLMPRTLAGRRTLTGYLFISPFILGFLLWFLIPALVAVWLTFQRWNLISPPEFVGFENIVHLWNDKLFWQSLKVTVNLHPRLGPAWTRARLPAGAAHEFQGARHLVLPHRLLPTQHRAGRRQRRPVGMDPQHRVWPAQCHAELLPPAQGGLAAGSRPGHCPPSS